MKKRIQKIIDNEQLSSSKFADMIGVQRSSISHILSGRNNPSLDFVQKILKNFKNLDTEWLLFGKGSMYRNSPDDLFTKKETKNIEDEKSEPIKITEAQPKKEFKTEVQHVKIPEKILVLFSDNTFSAYNSK